MRPSSFLMMAAALVAAFATRTATVSTTVASGVYEHRTLRADGRLYRYSVYVPARYRAGTAVPLLVMIHGCNATDDELAAATEYDALAEQHDFIVLYPDVDVTDAAHGHCWKGLWRPSGETRNHGDAAAIAAMTRTVSGSWDVDRNRVYAIGMSSGAFEAAILGADYPDLYAAIGIHSGAAYMRGAAGCLGHYRPLVNTNALASAALHTMNVRARVMPVIVFHGDRDRVVPYQCGRQALAQWLATDDLVLRSEHRSPVPGAPTRVTRSAVPGGHAFTVSSYGGTAGCVAEFWTIRGMAHYWSGGSRKPASHRYTDPLGPSAAAASWDFFSRISMSGTDRSCVVRSNLKRRGAA